MRRGRGAGRFCGARDVKEPVYLAGPAWSRPGRQVMGELAGVMENAGYPVWLPFRDGIEGCYHELLARREEPGAWAGDAGVVARALFALETFQVVERCGCLVLNMNGRVPDEGAVFKAALAFVSGTPVILYKRDLRAELHGHDNAMITGLSAKFRTVVSPGALPGELDAARVRVLPACRPPGFPAGDSPLQEKAVEAGRSIWEMLREERPPAVGAAGWALFVERLALGCAALGASC